MSRSAEIKAAESGGFKFSEVNGFMGSNFLGWLKFPYGWWVQIFWV